MTFVLTLATVARKQKPKSTLLPSRRKTNAAPPLGETTSRFAQIAKTAIWLSGRLGEEGFKNKAQTTTLDSDLLHIDTPLPPFQSFVDCLPQFSAKPRFSFVFLPFLVSPQCCSAGYSGFDPSSSPRNALVRGTVAFTLSRLPAML